MVLTKKKGMIDTSTFIRKNKSLGGNLNTTYVIFDNSNDTHRVTNVTERGIRVLVAKYPDFYKIYFNRYMEIGTPGFPNGVIIVWNMTNEQMEPFHYDSIAIHPSGGHYQF